MSHGWWSVRSFLALVVGLGSWIVFSLLQGLFLVAPFLFMHCTFGLSSFEKFPSVAASIVVIWFTSTLAQASSHRHVNQTFRAVRRLLRLNVAVLVAGLTVGMAILEIVSDSVRIYNNLIGIGELGVDLGVGLAALFLGLRLRHGVLQRQIPDEEKISWFAGLGYFLSAMALYSLYTALLSGTFETLETFGSAQPSTLWSHPFTLAVWILFTLAAFLATSEGMLQINLLSHPGSGSSEEVTQQRLRNGLIALTLLSLTSLLWLSSVFAIAPDQQQKYLCTTDIIEADCPSETAKAHRG